MYRFETLSDDGWRLKEVYHNMASAKAAVQREHRQHPEQTRIVDSFTGDIFSWNVSRQRFDRDN